MCNLTAKEGRGGKGRGVEFIQGNIRCWTSPCCWKRCRNGEAGAFLFPLLFFLTSNPSGGFTGIVPSRDTGPSPTATPTEDPTQHQHQGWETFFPGPHSPSQPHCSLLKEESPEAASKAITVYHCFFVCFIKRLHSALKGTFGKHFNQW